MNKRSAHVYPLPDGRWIMMTLTDHEAYEYERDRFGEALALDNWREIREWRAQGRPREIVVDEGRAG